MLSHFMGQTSLTKSVEQEIVIVSKLCLLIACDQIKAFKK